jgi:hypothetical protein
MAAKCVFLRNRTLPAMADCLAGNTATEFETGTNHFVEFS